MPFIVTARKWRPQKFSDVVGQEHITMTLKNAIKNNRIAHDFLFTGPRGVGKTTTARILAKALNCLSPIDFEPCDECEICKSIQTNQFLDIIEIDGASNRGIDEIRTLRDSVKYPPTKGKYKVYIIDEVHMLTKESFNAFLKTLEEPPSYTIFIFATTDIHKVPQTIISRCQRFDFRRIQLDTIKEQLNKIALEEKIKIDDKTLTIIAKKADGALRDAESFFDQVVSFCGMDVDSATVSQMLNLIDDDVYFKLSDAILDKNFSAVFEITNIIYNHGWDFLDFMDGLLGHFRNIMTVILSGSADLVESAETYKSKYLEYRNKFSEGDILRLLNFLNKAQQEIRFTQNHKLKIEISLSQLIGLEKTSTISELLSTVDELKKNSKLNITAEDLPKIESALIQEPLKEQKSKLSEQNRVKTKSINSEKNVDLDFESIKNRWQSFVDSVSSEKGLIFGPFLQEIELVKLDGNKLSIQSKDAHAESIITDQEDYIQKKTMDFFGKRLYFKFLISESHSGDLGTDGAKKGEKKANSNKDKSPTEEFIISILGGEEIS